MPLQSEAAFRQLRAVVTGKARDVLDPENVRGGIVTQLRGQLEHAIAANQQQQVRGILVFSFWRCVPILPVTARLAPSISHYVKASIMTCAARCWALLLCIVASQCVSGRGQLSSSALQELEAAYAHDCARQRRQPIPAAPAQHGDPSHCSLLTRLPLLTHCFHANGDCSP